MTEEKQQSSVAAKAQEQAVISRLHQVPLLARLPAKFIQFIRKLPRRHPSPPDRFSAERGMIRAVCISSSRGFFRCARTKMRSHELNR